MSAITGQTRRSPWLQYWQVLWSPLDLMNGMKVKWPWLSAWIGASVLTGVVQSVIVIGSLRQLAEQLPPDGVVIGGLLGIISAFLNPATLLLAQAFMIALVLSLISALGVTEYTGFSRWFSVGRYFSFTRRIYPDICL